MPVLTLLGMGSVLKETIDNKIFAKVIDFLPSEQFNQIAMNISKSNNSGNIGKSLLILIVWVIISLVVTVITYNRPRFDK
jgi:ABC-2 type transport system permease protein